MDNIISSIASNVGIEDDVARKAIGHVLAFLKTEGPQDAVSKLFAAWPEAEQLAGQAGGGGLMGMMGSMGGGVMALGAKLMSLGMGMGQVQKLGKDVFAKGRELVGDDVMGDIVAGIPGLSQFA